MCVLSVCFLSPLHFYGQFQGVGGIDLIYVICVFLSLSFFSLLWRDRLKNPIKLGHVDKFNFSLYQDGKSNMSSGGERKCGDGGGAAF